MITQENIDNVYTLLTSMTPYGLCDYVKQFILWLCKIMYWPNIFFTYFPLKNYTIPCKWKLIIHVLEGLSMNTCQIIYWLQTISMIIEWGFPYKMEPLKNNYTCPWWTTHEYLYNELLSLQTISMTIEWGFLYKILEDENKTCILLQMNILTMFTLC